MINKTQEEVMQNWGVDNSDAPLATIRCLTFNQEAYISQALDSFIMQRTSFPFEVVVHDDASTDGTADIIHEYEKKYPKIIKPIYETENQWSKHDGSLSRAVDVVQKGKYVAYCEGDDYWIDENKLQMQVEFLEKNPEYGLCYTRARTFLQNLNKYDRVIGAKSITFNELILKGNKIPTLTCCCRKDIYDKYHKEIHPETEKWLMGDYPLWLYYSENTRIKYLRKITGCYRVLKESASHSTDLKKIIAFDKSVYDIRKKFILRHNDVDLLDIVTNVHFFDISWKTKKRDDVIKYGKLLKKKTIKQRIKIFIAKYEYLYNSILRK